MKITFPECQIEMSAEELILLIDHTNLTDAGTQLVCEIEDIKKTLPEIDSNLIKRFEELEAATDPIEGVNFEETQQPKKKSQPREVQVLTDEGWATFSTCKQAAEYLKVSQAWLGKSLKLGKTCNGHHVRYANPVLDACLAEIDKSNKMPYQPTNPVR